MGINEIFLKPTVKQVIFQLNYPNLFFLESKIGDFQLTIMDKFPESSILIKRSVVFVDGERAGSTPDTAPELADLSNKVWQFKKKDGTVLNLTINSLALVSPTYKSYDKGDGEHFRNVINSIVSSFMGIIKLPILSRIGLRYIDECPVNKKDNEWFGRYYRSTLPISRFDVESAYEMRFMAQVLKGPYRLGYVESLIDTPNGYRLILDFDGSANDVDPSDFLHVLDDLHGIISNEYDLSITENLKRVMRGESDGS